MTCWLLVNRISVGRKLHDLQPRAHTPHILMLFFFLFVRRARNKYVNLEETRELNSF